MSATVRKFCVVSAPSPDRLTRRDSRLHQHRNLHCNATQNGGGMEGRAPEHPVRLGLKQGRRPTG
eukprot:2507825-Rhodomonas_salina.1